MSAPVRVVHVVVAGEIGGAERMLVDLASRPSLSHADHAVAVASPSAELVGMLRDGGLCVRDRGPVREHPAAFLWRSLGPVDVAWLVQVLSEERAQIVHLHTFASQVLGTRAAWGVGAKIVRTEHSTRVYEDLSCWPFSRWSLARADAAVAISEHVRRVAAREAPWAEAKLRVVHNGVDLTRFTPRVRSGGRPFRFAFVGRLEPRKGVDLAIEALSLVTEARLDVVGDGAERSELEERARALHLEGRVTFHGRVADPRTILAGCGAAICSSRQEGLGIALLEAMGMGLPVVGFAVGGVPEAVEDGVTGWLAQPGSPAALAARMREAARDPARAETMGRAARRRMEERFSIQQMCSSYGELYASLIR